jgi:Calx-beta domain
MNTHPAVLRRLITLILTAALWLGWSAHSRAGDVSLVVLSKGQAYIQTNATGTIFSTNGLGAFSIYAFVQGTGVLSGVYAYDVRFPDEGVEFSSNVDGFSYEEFATSNTELESFLPPGRYNIDIFTAQDSNYTATVTLPATAYPNIPKVLNWDAAQNIDPLADYTLSWTPMSGGSAQDFIILNIREEFISEANGDPEPFVYSSPFLGEPGQLNGLSNSIVIPAGSLNPGRRYYVNLTFVNFTTYSSNLIAGAAVGVAFTRETETTIAAETIPVGGRIQFASTNLTVNEADGTLSVTLLRVGGSEGEVSALLSSVGGTATAGLDFGSVSEDVEFDDGETSRTVSISITDDSFLEGPERFRLGLSTPDGQVSLTRDTNAIVTITDSETNSAGKISFSAAAYQVIESNTTVNVIVRREGGTTGDVGGTIQIIGGTAEDEDDFETGSGETMAFMIPSGKNAATNVLTIYNDEEAEGNETVIMRLESLSGGASFGKIGTNTLTILDDESSFAFEVARSTNVENQATAKITVLRSGSTLTAASVDYAAYVEEDDIAEAHTSVIAKPLQTRKPITAPSSPGSSAPAVLSLARSPQKDFTPAIDAPEATSGVDFLGTTGTLVFPKGVFKKSFDVRILDDLTLESTEVIRLALRNPTNAQLGELDSASLYIKDNDLAGTVSFVLTNQNVKENVGGAKIMVIRTGGLASNIMVRLSTAEGTATDAADYVGFSSNLVFRGRETKKTIPLSVIQDSLVESNENLTLHLSTVGVDAESFTPAGIDGQYAGLCTKTNLTVNIADDDKGGTITFDKAALSVNESVTNLAIILKRSGGSASNVTVRLQTVDAPLNPATAGSDYTAIDTIVTFGPGETRKTNQLHIINDTIADAIAPETIRLTLTEFTGGAKPGNSNAIVAIIDDESSVSFASATSSGVENRSVTINVARGGFLGSTSTVEYMFMDGTATNGLDYTGVNGTLTFKPREVLKTIVVPVATDPNVESTPETFTVILKNPTNALLGETTTNTVSITDAPAVGAIPASGPAFFKATIKGINGNTLSKTIDITSNGVNIVQSSFNTSLGWITGLNGLNNKISVSSSSARVLQNYLQFVNLHAAAPGVVNLGGNQASGGVLWHFSDISTPLRPGSPTIHAIHDYGSGQEGTTGSITIDVLDPANHVITGRFDFTAKEDGGDTFVRITGSFRSTGTIVN